MTAPKLPSGAALKRADRAAEKRRRSFDRFFTHAKGTDDMTGDELRDHQQRLKAEAAERREARLLAETSEAGS